MKHLPSSKRKNTNGGKYLGVTYVIKPKKSIVNKNPRHIIQKEWTRPWKAKFSNGKKTFHIGLFDTQEKAAQARYEWMRINIFGGIIITPIIKNTNKHPEIKELPEINTFDEFSSERSRILNKINNNNKTKKK